MTKRICVIPARMASSRYPGKPMALLLGLPLILHVWQRCRLESRFDRVIVATCDQEIMDCVIDAGGEAIMTDDTHERCTDRVSQAVEIANLDLLDDDLVLMVQGDEVLVNPDMLGRMIEVFEETHPPAVNLISRLYKAQDHDDVNVVKVATGLDGRIVFLSRAAIPSRARADDVPMYQQTGVIAYAASFLEEFSLLKQTPLEIVESIDMLRLIEHGLPLYGVKTDIETIGVDTPDDGTRAERLLKQDIWTEKYLPSALN
ncbi:MAG: 3-deoxy-manno-octulosonate cytidylyltransferase [Mariprofundaceae bacterium]|nr:3-deoxy-manno-octulosonate cytidylyltransferase [Mariprofundaceae bacterium]